MSCVKCNPPKPTGPIEEHIQVYLDSFGSLGLSFKKMERPNDPECFWVALVDGKRVIVKSGKNIWKKKQHASSAITNHLSNAVYKAKYSRLYQQGFEPRHYSSYPPWAKDEKSKREAVTRWKKEHVEIITLDEWKERGCP